MDKLYYYILWYHLFDIDTKEGPQGRLLIGIIINKLVLHFRVKFCHALLIMIRHEKLLLSASPASVVKLLVIAAKFHKIILFGYAMHSPFYMSIFKMILVLSGH